MAPPSVTRVKIGGRGSAGAPALRRPWRTRIFGSVDVGLKGDRLIKAWRDNLEDQWDTFKTEGRNACGILDHMADFLWPRRNLQAKVGDSKVYIMAAVLQHIDLLTSWCMSVRETLFR